MNLFVLISVTKDLAKLSVNSTSKLRRRHSITLCESRHRKSSTESTTSSCSSERSQVSPDRPESTAEIDNPVDPTLKFASLNVAAIQEQSTVQDSYEIDANVVPKPLKTLDLRLEEVAHIRSVLTKAELEAMPIDSCIRDNVARGKVRSFLFLLVHTGKPLG